MTCQANEGEQSMAGPIQTYSPLGYHFPRVYVPHYRSKLKEKEGERQLTSPQIIVFNPKANMTKSKLI
jgi:hypothetical protein